MKNVSLSVLLLLLIALPVPTAFAGGSQESSNNAVTLQMMAPWADKELEGFKPVLAKFEELNPGIKVEYRTGKPEDTATILTTQFSVKKTPVDIVDTA